MYEKLTVLIPELSNNAYGEWEEQHGDGSPEAPYSMPHVVYSIAVTKLTEEVYQFVDAHQEFGLRQYSKILEDHQIQWDTESMKQADVSVLDGKTVMALLLGTIRAERFCDGVLLDMCSSGYIACWLERLKAIDENH